MRPVGRRDGNMAGIFAGMLLVGGIAWFAWILLNLPRIREERAAALLAERAAENSETCTRLGLGPERGLAVFGACARELDLVRQREGERLESPFL